MRSGNRHATGYRETRRALANLALALGATSASADILKGPHLHNVRDDGGTAPDNAGLGGSSGNSDKSGPRAADSHLDGESTGGAAGCACRTAGGRGQSGAPLVVLGIALAAFLRIRGTSRRALRERGDRARGRPNQASVAPSGWNDSESDVRSAFIRGGRRRRPRPHKPSLAGQHRRARRGATKP